jgi:RecA-family ATPase
MSDSYLNLRAGNRRDIAAGNSPLGQKLGCPSRQELPGFEELPWKVETLTSLLSLPDPGWIIDQVIPEDAFVLIFGPPGCGKSFLALDLAIHLGLHRPNWLGHEIDLARRPLYVAAEGGGGIIKRARAWFKGNGIEPPLDSPVQIIREPIDLLDETTTDRLLLTWAGLANPEPLFLDTWSRCLAGANENSAEHTSAAVAILDDYRATTQSSVVALHHTPLDARDRPRGSSALLAACDVAIMVENRNGTRVATVTKSRDGEDGLQFAFILDKVELGHDQEAMLGFIQDAHPLGIDVQDLNEKMRELGVTDRMTLHNTRRQLKNKNLVRETQGRVFVVIKPE